MEKLASVLNNPWILVPLVIWTLAWKGIALWKSARRNQIGWFITLLVLNTLGILEIVYIFYVTKRGAPEETEGTSTDYSVKKKII